jgi:hypothetical protein
MAQAIQIPNTIKQAEKALTGLDRLSIATEWERAAIVWAFTYEGKPGQGGPGRSNAPHSARCSIRQFAALKLPGLKSHSTIEGYRIAWKRAMTKAGAMDVGPPSTTGRHLRRLGRFGRTRAEGVRVLHRRDPEGRPRWPTAVGPRPHRTGSVP